MLKSLIAMVLSATILTPYAQAQSAPPRVLLQDVVAIDIPDFSLFKAGTQSEIKIETRILAPGYNRVDISIPNLSDFPGATFDSSTGIFSWSPNPTTDQTRQILLEPSQLKVQAVAFPDNSSTAINGTTKTVLVYVQTR